MEDVDIITGTDDILFDDFSVTKEKIPDDCIVEDCGTFTNYVDFETSITKYSQSVVIYFPKLNFIVSNEVGTIKIWDYEKSVKEKTGSLVKTIRRDSDDVSGAIHMIHDMISFSDEVVIGGDDSSRIFGYNLRDDECLFDIRSPSEQDSKKFLKLSSDLFIAVHTRSILSYAQLHLYSFSERKHLRQLISEENFRFDDSSQLIISQSHENCIIMNCGSTNTYDEVLLINFVKNEIQQRVVLNETHGLTWIYFMDVFMDSSDREILVLLSNQNELYFVKLEDSSVLKILPSKNQFEGSVFSRRRIHSFERFHPKLCMVASCDSTQILDLEKFEFLTDNDHPGVCMFPKAGMLKVKVMVKDRNSVTFSCTRKSTPSFRLFSFVSDKYAFSDGLSKLELEDLKERVEFVRNERVLYLFEDEDKDGVIIKLQNVKIENLQRIYLLM